MPSDPNVECTVFFLPGLGLDAGSVAEIAAALGDGFRVVGIDLLPRGSAVSAELLADVAVETIAREATGGPFLLCGHSLGGKVAAVVMARVLAGSAPVFGLAGAVLLAPSPPAPEPMDDAQRDRMLGWAEGDRLSVADAERFLDDNLGGELSPERRAAALESIVSTPTGAWRDWLREGSRQDLSAEVGVLDLPVTLIAGDADDDLGAHAQPGLHGGTYPRGRYATLPGVGHLLPYEAPDRVAEEIRRMWDGIRSASPRVPDRWGAVIASSRVDAAVRGVMARRSLVDDSDRVPLVLSPAQMATLRAVAERIVPQGAGPRIDLAARVDGMLADGTGDGWRPDGLPADAVAYRAGLDALAAEWPDDPHAQDAFVARVAAEGLAGDGPLGPQHIRAWFEDARNDLARAWLAHPASLARVGYDGFAVGGSGATPAGWDVLAAGRREAWEPEELGALSPAADAPSPGERRSDR